MGVDVRRVEVVRQTRREVDIVAGALLESLRRFHCTRKYFIHFSIAWSRLEYLRKEGIFAVLLPPTRASDVSGLG